MKHPTPLLTLVLTALLLQGCAAAVVTGAATGASVAYDRRTAGTVIEDQNIELKAMSAFYDRADINDPTHINTTSYNLTVLMTGEAPTPELRANAEALVRAIPKVQRVVNEVKIASPSSMTARSSDALITTKVKSALFGIKIEGFSPARVKVVTEAGSVYLMGLVTRAEAAATIETVRRVGGVQRVVDVLERID